MPTGLHLVPMLVLVPVLVLVVPVELAGERHAVAAVVQRHASAQEGPVPRPADAGPRVGRIGGGVLDHACGRGVVVGAPPAAAGPVIHAVARVLQSDVGADLPVRATRVGAELRPRALEQRLAVARVRRDHVDQPADRVRAVEERRRPAHDLDALGAAGIDSDAVVARLARQVSGANPVLQDQHPVAVEAADDRPVRSGPEAADGNARLVLQRGGKIAGRLSRDIEYIERGHRVERLQRRLGSTRRGRHGDLLLDGREAQHEVGSGCSPGFDQHRLPARGQIVPLRYDLVLAGRQVADLGTLPCASVSAKAPEPTTRISAPRMGSPFTASVTEPCTAPASASAARSGVPLAAAAIAATTNNDAILQDISSYLSPGPRWCSSVRHRRAWRPQGAHSRAPPARTVSPAVAVRQADEACDGS